MRGGLWKIEISDDSAIFRLKRAAADLQSIQLVALRSTFAGIVHSKVRWSFHLHVHGNRCNMSPLVPRIPKCQRIVDPLFYDKRP